MCSTDDGIVRIVSIDPGSTLMGITLWEFDPETMSLKMVASWTANFKPYEKTVLRDIDAMQKRLEGLKQTLRTVFHRFPPHAVCTESNFMQKKRVSGYRGLLLVEAAIRDVLYETCPAVELDIMHVIKAKEFMGAKDNSKEEVHKKVGVIEDITYPEEFDVDAIGPDARDSIAIGYCYIKLHWEQLKRLGWLYESVRA